MQLADAVSLGAVALHAFFLKVETAAGALHTVMGTVPTASAYVNLFLSHLTLLCHGNHANGSG